MPKIQLIQMIFWSKTNEGKITFLGRASVCHLHYDSHWQADCPTELFFCKYKSTKIKMVAFWECDVLIRVSQCSHSPDCWLPLDWGSGTLFLDPSSRPSPPSRLNKLCMGATLSFTEWIFCWICFDTGRFFTGMLISWCHDVVKSGTVIGG